MYEVRSMLKKVEHMLGLELGFMSSVSVDVRSTLDKKVELV